MNSINLSGITLICTLIIACAPAQSRCQTQPAQKSPYTDIAGEVLDTMLSRDDVVLLDVRTPEETANGKIGDALEADVLSADFINHIQELDKTKYYVVYCRSGRRSVTASRIMAEQGFLHVNNLIGGYDEWRRKKL